MTWREFRPRRYRAAVGRVAVLMPLVAGASWACEVSPTALIEGAGKGLSLLWLFLPPDWSALPDMVPAALSTLAVALIATPVGAVASIVVGLAGARNVAPRWLRTPVRSLLAVERGLPEIVVLLILVAAFGMGPFSGVVALAIGSVGMLGKLVADAVEEVDGRIVDAVACTGATPAQVVRFAVLPTVLPALVTHALFRLEVNVRASVLLGATGAGGIGYELNVAMSQLQYQRGTVAALVSLALVFAVEQLADAGRHWVVGGGPA